MVRGSSSQGLGVLMVGGFGGPLKTSSPNPRELRELRGLLGDVGPECPPNSKDPPLKA